MIGDRIRYLRSARGITQETLAKHLHLSSQAVSKWEQNATTPDVSMLIPLADYFGVSTDYLLRDSENSLEKQLESLVEIKIRERKSPVFMGCVKNNSGLKIDYLAFKVKFLNVSGCVIDYREETVCRLGPSEMKQFYTFSRVAKDVASTETEILEYSLF